MRPLLILFLQSSVLKGGAGDQLVSCAALLAVFRRHQPGREFAAAFEPKPDKMSNWHRYASRRERFAALVYLVRDRIWSF